MSERKKRVSRTLEALGKQIAADTERAKEDTVEALMGVVMPLIQKKEEAKPDEPK